MLLLLRFNNKLIKISRKFCLVFHCLQLIIFSKYPSQFLLLRDQTKQKKPSNKKFHSKNSHNLIWQIFRLINALLSPLQFVVKRVVLLVFSSQKVFTIFTLNSSLTEKKIFLKTIFFKIVYKSSNALNYKHTEISVIEEYLLIWYNIIFA